MALSNNEKYIVQGMLKDGISLKEISEALDKPYKAIQYYVSQYKDSLAKIEANKEEQAKKEEVEQKKPKKPKKVPKYDTKPVPAGDLFAYHTQMKKNRGIAVLTEAAAEKADIHVKNLPLPDQSDKIHKIKDRND